MGETQGLINQSMEQFPLDESSSQNPEGNNLNTEVINEEILDISDVEDDSEEDDEEEESDDEELTEISTSELLQNSISIMSEGEVDNQIEEINTMELLERYEGRRRGNNALRDHLRQQNGRESGLNIDQLLNYPSNET